MTMNQVVLVRCQASRTVAAGQLAAGQFLQRAVHADKQDVLGS